MRKKNWSRPCMFVTVMGNVGWGSAGEVGRFVSDVDISFWKLSEIIIYTDTLPKVWLSLKLHFGWWLFVLSY